MDNQPRLDFELPPSVNEIDPWKLNSAQFALRDNVMWHSSDSDHLRKDGHEEKALHVGSQRAAVDRGNRFMHPVEVVAPMGNTRDDPITDDDANTLDPDGQPVNLPGDAPAGRAATLDDERAWNEGSGFYYANSAEDVGSVSAVLPGAHSYKTYADHAKFGNERSRTRRGMHPEARSLADEIEKRETGYEPQREAAPRTAQFAEGRTDPLFMADTVETSEGRKSYWDGDVHLPPSRGMGTDTQYRLFDSKNRRLGDHL